MKDLMGLVHLDTGNIHLQEITQHRILPAVPFGGRYRIIDFVLSSMVNSDIENVGILSHVYDRSLLGHLQGGKGWGLARKREGLFFLPPPRNISAMEDPGDIISFAANIDYFKKSRQKYVVVSKGNIICNLNYRQVLQFHQEKLADITILCSSEEGRQDIGMYLMETSLLIDLIQKCTAERRKNLITDGIVPYMASGNVYTYQVGGYVACIASLHDYYRHNMSLLNPEVWKKLFLNSAPIYSKVRDTMPVKYNSRAEVKNSIIANGCVIEGRVENSILFRGVKVRKGALLRNCIVMQGTEIGEHAVLENMICDKDVIINKQKWIRGTSGEPIVIAKGVVI